jgi:hypothetical protein
VDRPGECFDVESSGVESVELFLRCAEGVLVRIHEDVAR